MEPPPLDLGGATIAGSLSPTFSGQDFEAQMELARKHAFGRSPYF